MSSVTTQRVTGDTYSIGTEATSIGAAGVSVSSSDGAGLASLMFSKGGKGGRGKHASHKHTYTHKIDFQSQSEKTNFHKIKQISVNLRLTGRPPLLRMLGPGPGPGPGQGPGQGQG